MTIYTVCQFIGLWMSGFYLGWAARAKVKERSAARYPTLTKWMKSEPERARDAWPDIERFT